MTTERVQEALTDFIKPKVEYGQLGMPLGSGNYQYKANSRPGYVYVVVNNGHTNTVGVALNLGVPLIPKYPVRIEVDERGQKVIRGIDTLQMESFVGKSGALPAILPNHSHEIGFLTDWVSSKRIIPGQMRPVATTNTTLKVKGFYYKYKGVQKYFSETEFDYTTPTDYRPGTSDYKCILKVCVDPVSNALVFITSTPVTSGTTYTDTDFAAVAIGILIPVATLVIEEGQTAFGLETDLTDARNWIDSTYEIEFNQSANVTLASSTTEATLIGAGVGTLSYPAGTLSSVGRIIDFECWGYLSDTGTPTLRLKFKLGSTVVLDTTAITLASSITDKLWRLIGTATVQVAGASGKLFVQGQFIYNGGTVIDIVSTAQLSIDLTPALVANITAQWSASSASNTITATNLKVKVA